jgi:Domain of unknown function (DUF4129)
MRLAVVGVALLLLLGIVALASRSGFGHATASRPTPGYISWASSVFLILFVLMIPFAVWIYLAQQRHVERSARSFQARVARSFVILAMILMVGFAVAWLRRSGHLPDLTTLFNASTGRAGNRGKHNAVAPYSPTFKWPVLWATLGLLAAVAALLFWRWRRHGELAPRPVTEQAVAAELAASIGEAIDDLEAEPDARVAVIAAYARMERVLERGGIPRQPSETPVEYLRRALDRLTANHEAVTRLTSLFERAKFSHHAIDPSMKRDAIEALTAIRDGLEATPA